MGKKQKKVSSPMPKSAPKADSDNGLTLKDLLSSEMLNKLKAQADEMKQTEAARKEDLRKQEEEKKKQEQKRLENDFSYLLENSDPNWSKHK
ncbi:YqkE family protein [Paenibacillus sp. LHD-38]|uniref:YqkE family protein n=1 Tax=Paenibacillus sp. LHD-38 TaxID=3072143 RepID=UPI0028104B91|nr:YqkE family protein [Paenibacillus sp. LHD-38]MDQ8737701.1 YqkE family protein [Paenibacillus sp. LHD-38]